MILHPDRVLFIETHIENARPHLVIVRVWSGDRADRFSHAAQLPVPFPARRVSSHLARHAAACFFTSDTLRSGVFSLGTRHAAAATTVQPTGYANTRGAYIHARIHTFIHATHTNVCLCVCHISLVVLRVEKSIWRASRAYDGVHRQSAQVHVTCRSLAIMQWDETLQQSLFGDVRSGDIPFTARPIRRGRVALYGAARGTSTRAR